jgi:hypothetical protein
MWSWFHTNANRSKAQVLREVEELHGVQLKKSQFYKDVEELRLRLPQQEIPGEVLDFYTNATRQLNRLEVIERMLKELLDRPQPMLIPQPRPVPLDAPPKINGIISRILRGPEILSFLKRQLW